MTESILKQDNRFLLNLHPLIEDVEAIKKIRSAYVRNALLAVAYYQSGGQCGDKCTHASFTKCS